LKNRRLKLGYFIQSAHHPDFVFVGAVSTAVLILPGRAVSTAVLI